MPQYLEELVFKYTLISLLSELDGLLWNNTSPGSIYTFNSTSDYDSKSIRLEQQEQ